MANRLPFLLGILAVLAVVAYSSIFVVNEREQAIVIRFGEIQSVKTEPGLYFKVPLTFMDFDSVQYIEDRKLRFDLEDIRVQVSGGKFYEVDAFVLYQISDAERFRETVSGDVVAVESRLRTRLNSALRTVYGLRGFESALSVERASMMREVRDQLRPEAQALGVTIDDVRIRRTDLTKEVSQQTYDRMTAERLAEAEAIRARGIEAGQRLRSIADRQVVEFVSAAGRDSQIIRGEGDAERNGIFADAFQRDQEFFKFYRSMEAYGKAIASDGTTMVLSPDSEFFEFFKNSAGAPAAPVSPAPAN